MESDVHLAEPVTRLWPYALGAFALFLGWQAYSAMLRRDGALHEQVRALETRNAALEDEAGRIDTVYRTDTITLRKVRYATDTLLTYITDTVIKEKVTNLIRHERDACNAVIQTCEQKQANLLAQLANRDSVIAVKDKQRPAWIKRTFGCAGPFAATTKGAGLGAACGVRFP